MHQILSDMFSLPIPLLEKIIRPIIIYVLLIAAFRIFGRRELAQLNPMDFTVLLIISNTVQNSIIGNDDSVTGGAIGAASLFVVNWTLNWLTYRFPRLETITEGKAITLIDDGVMDKKTIHDQQISPQDFHEVLHRQGIEDVHRVRRAVLEASGTITVIPKDDDRLDEINQRLASIEQLLRDRR